MKASASIACRFLDKSLVASMQPKKGSPLPGLSLSLGYSVTYLSLLVLIPLSACFITAASLSPTEFWNIVWSERTRAAYSLTFTTLRSKSFMGGNLDSNSLAIKGSEGR